MLDLQNVQHLRRPGRIGTIVEGQGDVTRVAFAPAPDDERTTGLEDPLAGDQRARRIVGQAAQPVAGRRDHPQQFACALVVQVVAVGQRAQSGGDLRAQVRVGGQGGMVEHLPDARILGAHPPERDLIHPEAARGLHLIERTHGVEIPHRVGTALRIGVAEGGIQAGRIERRPGSGVLRTGQGVLNGVGGGGRIAARPVVAVVADVEHHLPGFQGAQPQLQRRLQPPLGRHRTGKSAIGVLVVGHQVDPVADRAQRRIRIAVVIERQRHVEPQSQPGRPGVQLPHEGHERRLAGRWNLLEIDHQAARVDPGHGGEQTCFQRRPATRVVHRQGERPAVPALGPVVVVVDQRHQAQVGVPLGPEVAEQRRRLDRVVGRQPGGGEVQPFGVEFRQALEVLLEGGKTVVVPVDVEAGHLGSPPDRPG